MSPHLPIPPAEIATASIEAAQAGASIIHLHARHPEPGKPDPRPELFKQFLPVIKQSTDVVMNVSTGGGLGMSMDARLLAATLGRAGPPAGLFRPRGAGLHSREEYGEGDSALACRDILVDLTRDFC